MTVLAVLLLAACDTKSEFEKTVEKINEECPMSMGDIGDVTSIRYEKPNLVMTCDINEDYADLSSMKSRPELVKRNALIMCQNSTGAIKKLIDMLSKENAGFKIVYRGKASGTEVSVVITGDEIREGASTDDSSRDPLLLLRSQIETSNVQMPMQIEDGMTVTKAYLDGDYVVYNVVIDEDMYAVDNIKASKDEVKANIKEALGSGDDPTMKIFVRFCKNAGKGIAYKYVGNRSGESATVYIGVDEL